MPPLVEIGLTDLPKTEGLEPLQPPTCDSPDTYQVTRIATIFLHFSSKKAFLTRKYLTTQSFSQGLFLVCLLIIHVSCYIQDILSERTIQTKYVLMQYYISIYYNMFTKEVVLQHFLSSYLLLNYVPEIQHNELKFLKEHTIFILTLSLVSKYQILVRKLKLYILEIQFM